MEKWKQFYNKYLRNCIGAAFVIAFCMNFTIETLSRHSPISGLQYLFDKPAVFFCNTIIIFGFMSTAVLFKRRVFVFFWHCGWWLALGIINSVILLNRMTPFTVKDLAVLEDGLSIASNYLSKKLIVLIIVGAVLLIALIVVMFIFAPRKKTPVGYKKAVPIFLAVLLFVAGSVGLAVKTNTVETFFGNLAYAYRDYGVPYCFLNTWANTGIKMPFGYSEKAVLDIFAPGDLSENGISDFPVEDDGKTHPNIIFLQLESFIDPYRVKQISMDKDPIPFFRSLLAKYSHGELTVPAVGAGTANTEFEVMTGISVRFFGPGEYPYKAVLTKKTCESLPYNLKAIGYATHAIHNHRGMFYNRNTVFANLGYDDFTSLEYMNYTVKTPKNWAKDEVLIDYIMEALESTKEEDMIYAISVQGHGKYPTEQIIAKPEITVEAATPEEKWQWEYYVNQLREMDTFVKDLTEKLSKSKEKTVLVMYGDHIPAIDITEENYQGGNLYNTQYVIWSNYKLKPEEKDLKAYQLGAEVLDRVGIYNVGTVMTYHQKHRDSEVYLRNLKLLAYDMLYGKGYIYGEKNPFEPTKPKMGIRKIKVTEVVKIGEKYYIKGENFTEFSKIWLDGNILSTVYLGPNLLGLLEKVDEDRAKDMKVSQVEKNKEILSTTE